MPSQRRRCAEHTVLERTQQATAAGAACTTVVALRCCLAVGRHVGDRGNARYSTASGHAHACCDDEHAVDRAARRRNQSSCIRRRDTRSCNSIACASHCDAGCPSYCRCNRRRDAPSPTPTPETHLHHDGGAYAGAARHCHRCRGRGEAASSLALRLPQRCSRPPPTYPSLAPGSCWRQRMPSNQQTWFKSTEFPGDAIRPARWQRKDTMSHCSPTVTAPGLLSPHACPAT